MFKTAMGDNTGAAWSFGAASWSFAAAVWQSVSAGEEETAVPSPISPGSADRNIRELYYLMENVDMVRYAVLSFFIQYRTQNKHVIEELLQAGRQKEQDASEAAADPETP